MIDGRRNSLNALRLGLATTVIASHTAGWFYGSDHVGGKTTWGSLAVFGFFGISGYLIAQSAEHNGVGRYLWQRFLRIFPAYWLCLGILVLFFGSVGWIHFGHHPGNCGLACYVQRRGVPFFFHNSYLRQFEGWRSYIPGTLTVHHGYVQDNPMWTLFYEFLCYLLVAGLALTGLLRRRFAVLVLTTCWWAAEIVLCVLHRTNVEFDLTAMAIFGPVFLTGCLIYLYRDVVPDSGWLAIAGVAVLAAGFWLPLGNRVRPNSVDVFAPALAYTMLWLGAHLPLQRVGARNDYSYGMYLYGAPVLALIISTWRVSNWTYPGVLAVTIVGTAAFAAFSWWLVEKPALSLRKMVPPWARTRVQTPRPATIRRVPSEAG